MDKVTFHRVFKQAMMLTLEEQRELRDLLNLRITSAQSQITEEEFERMMVEKGIMSVPPPIKDLTPYKNRKLAEVKGKPVSEVLIEERR